VRYYSACVLSVVLVLAVFNVSCGNFIQNLRKGLDEPDSIQAEQFAEDSDPTYGGNWSERGYLSREATRGNRSPASQSELNDDDARGGWSSTRSSPISTSTVPNLEPESRKNYKNGSRATRDDFVDQSQEEGSLWASNGQTNYYFTRNKVRSPGDIITLLIDNSLYRDIGAEIKRALSPREKQNEVDQVQAQFKNKFMAGVRGTKTDQLSVSAAAPESSSKPSPAEPVVDAKASAAPASVAPVANAEINSVIAPTVAPNTLATMSPEELEKLVPRATLSDVDIYPLLDFKPGETMMGEIIERYPNGNYKVRTVKKVPYKRGTAKLVSVVGIVKGSDITEDTDVINAGKLYEYRVEVSN
jgi:flagellar basal body L-ring protein FlgH